MEIISVLDDERMLGFELVPWRQGAHLCNEGGAGEVIRVRVMVSFGTVFSYTHLYLIQLICTKGRTNHEYEAAELPSPGVEAQCGQDGVGREGLYA